MLNLIFGVRNEQGLYEAFDGDEKQMKIVMEMRFLNSQSNEFTTETKNQLLDNAYLFNDYIYFDDIVDEFKGG